MHGNRLGVRATLAVVTALYPLVAHAGGSRVAAPGAAKAWRVLISSPAVRNPTGIAIDARGNPRTSKWAYVADAYSQRIVKFGTGGKVLASWPYGKLTDRGTPGAVAVGGSGNVFVADRAAGTVSKFSPFGKVLSTWSNFQSPRSIAVDSAGNVYLAEYAVHRVTKLSSSGKLLTQWDIHTVWGGGSYGSPTGVALDRPNSLYVSTSCQVSVDCGAGIEPSIHYDLLDGLLEFLSSGPRQGYVMEDWIGLGHSFSGQPQEPPYLEAEPIVTVDGISADRESYLYVAGLLWPRGGKAGRGVLGYTPFGFKWETCPLPRQGAVAGIAVDGQGALYVSQGPRILKLSRSRGLPKTVNEQKPPHPSPGCSLLY